MSINVYFGNYLALHLKVTPKFSNYTMTVLVMAHIHLLCGCFLASKHQNKFIAWQPAMQVFLKNLMEKSLND